MKNHNVLNTMSKLIECRDINDSIEFIPIEEKNAIYINYGNTKEDLYKAYYASKEISILFAATVVFTFGGTDIFMQVDKNTRRWEIEEEYKREQEIQYALYVNEAFSKAIQELNGKNIMGKIEEVYPLLTKPESRKHISLHQTNCLSKALCDVYQSTLPDDYLDEMVEKVKVMKKI